VRKTPNGERLERMRRAMEAARLDALVVRLPENVLLLSGFWPMIGASTLVFPLGEKPVCVIPHGYEEEANASLWDVDAVYFRYGVLDAPDPRLAMPELLSKIAQNRSWRRVGYEGSFETVAPSWNAAESLVPASQNLALLGKVFGRTAELVDLTSLLEAERSRKTPYEAERLRLASEISSFGLKAFAEAVGVGKSGVELAAAVEESVMVAGTGHKGASRVRAFAQVATGAEEGAVGYRPNEVSTARRLVAGDLALLELGVVVDGYWADRTRVRVAGSPSQHQRELWEIVERAQRAGVAAMKPGARAYEVDRAARKIIADAGFFKFFPHITGHGLGFRYHESGPILSPDSQEVLEEGMLTSVEPGLYDRSFGGIRLEDDVLVTASGAEVLGPFPMDLA